MEQRIKIQGIDLDPIADFQIKWLEEGIADKAFVDYANEFGKILANLHEHKKNKYLTIQVPKDENDKREFQNQSLSKSQIRNFFSTVKTLEMKQKFFDDPDIQAKLFMLKPLLAYAAKRNKSIAFDYFHEIMAKMLNPS